MMVEMQVHSQHDSSIQVSVSWYDYLSDAVKYTVDLGIYKNMCGTVSL